MTQNLLFFLLFFLLFPLCPSKIYRDFKFIFNSKEWKAGELAEEIKNGRWTMVIAPPDLVLQQKDNNKKDSIWRNIRKTLLLD